jgi:polyhydroxyalkanoate synthesis repressor PhaR
VQALQPRCALCSAIWILCSRNIDGRLSLQQKRAMIVKKYGNRRLYDTSDSRYITLEELAEKVRQGGEVRVVDAKTNEDLTAATLTQIVVEGRGAARLLPVPLLVQLVRLGDDALAEFLGQYVRWALEIYVNAKQGSRQFAPYNPLAGAPFGAADAFMRLFGGARPEPPSPSPPSSGSEIAELRRELEELKRTVKKRRR